LRPHQDRQCVQDPHLPELVQSTSLLQSPAPYFITLPASRNMGLGISYISWRRRGHWTRCISREQLRVQPFMQLVPSSLRLITSAVTIFAVNCQSTYQRFASLFSQHSGLSLQVSVRPSAIAGAPLRCLFPMQHSVILPGESWYNQGSRGWTFCSCRAVDRSCMMKSIFNTNCRHARRTKPPPFTNPKSVRL